MKKNADVFTTKELWSNVDVAVQYNTPVLKDGLLYGLSEKGMLFCLDASTGKTDWMDTTKRGGNFAAILDGGTVLFALPNTAQLLIFKPSDKEYAEVAQYKVAEKATYAFPIIAGKRIFVKDQEMLTLWSLE